MKSLYDLTHELNEIDKRINDLMDLPDSDEKIEQLAKLQNDVTQLVINKVDACAEYTRSLDDYLKLVEEREKQFKTLKQSIKKKKESWINYVTEAVKNTGTEKLLGKLNRVQLSKSSSVEINEAEFEIVKRNIDLQALELVRVKEVYEPNKDNVFEYLAKGNKLSWATIKENKKAVFKLGAK